MGLCDSVTLAIVLHQTIENTFKILVHVAEVMLSLMVNTGSEQGKKRKRQDSTKELTNDDITEAVQKRKKEAKLGGQVLHDANDTGEPSTNASNSKQSGKITLATGKNGKSNTGPNSGKESYM